MNTSNSTASPGKGKPVKPAKPYPEFPLYAHSVGQWAKKIRGKVHYFGLWADPAAALKKYNAVKDDLHAGKKPKEQTDQLTVKQVCNKFSHHKASLRDSGELSPRTYQDYEAACRLVITTFSSNRVATDLAPDDFAALRNKMTKKWGPIRVRDFIQRTRSIFKFAHESGLLDKPIRFGPGFKLPTKKTLRLERAKKGPKLFSAPQIRAMIRKAGQPLRSMILLGVSCGFGNADCGTLPLRALNLATGWVDYPRPKTGTPRRCPLWPETVEALREAIALRPSPRDEADADLVFVTKYGGSWHKQVDDNPISKEMAKLLKILKLHRGKGLSFYALRHVFETVGGEAKDQVAVDHIMGHTREDMASHYREKISDERLLAVSNHVRSWLFPKKLKKICGRVASSDTRGKGTLSDPYPFHRLVNGVLFRPRFDCPRAGPPLPGQQG